MPANARPLRWYDRRLAALALAAAGMLAAYGLASRAIDTGSLQQYFLTLVLLACVGNRLARTVRPKR